MAITYPIDRVATAKRWSFYRLSTGQVVSRNLDWPVADGGPVPGLDPDYVPLLQVSASVPPIDSRLQVLVQGAEPVVDLEASTISPAITVALRPAPELADAVRNEASIRKSQALSAYGISEHGDAYRALGLMQARADGQILTEEQTAWLGGIRVVAVDHIDAIDAAAAALIAWIDEHPGDLPDIGDTQWPAAPSA